MEDCMSQLFLFQYLANCEALYSRELYEAHTRSSIVTSEFQFLREIVATPL